MTRETKIPAIPDIRADNVVDVLRAIKSGLDVREARVGDPLDQMVTLRDLADLDLVVAGSGGRTRITGGGSLPVVVPGVTPDGYNPSTDLTTPPQPTNLTASGTFTNVYLSWDGAPYRNHAYTQIWRSQTNVLGDAVLVGVSSTNLFTDPVQENQTYYYWIRFVSQANVIGAYNSTSGTSVSTSQDPAGVIAALEGQILDSTLSQALASRIDLIDAAGTGLVDQVADLQEVFGTTVSAAQSAATAAQAASDAVVAKTAAILAQGGAETARDSAVTAKTSAETAASNASTSATSASSSATTAGTSASNAATSATAAANSATAAGNSASAAATSETNASTYATNAETASTASSSAKVAAESARDSAQSSATAAATSASTATTKATEASESASAANTSKVNAATSASNASTSASNAATSETNAAGSASNASTYASNAATSATNAGNSASAAATSASTAETKASEASQSATSASTSATNAATSASDASTYANNASTSATNASTSESNASTSAGAAATSATNAFNSATAAATSASTATTKASDASQSATAANESKTAAATSASNAATSATNAATSETNASGYASSAASSLQQVQATATGFDASKAWNFDAGDEGYVASGANLGWSTAGLRIDSTGNDPVLFSPDAVNLAGATSYLIRARVKRLAGTTWQGDVYYTTAAHSFSESYKKRIADTTVLNEWRVLEWDMSSLTAGGADWVSNTITRFRLDLGTTSADQFLIDWITVGRVAPQAYSVAISQEATARATSDGQLFAQYTVKIDNNGYVAGFGLASETINGTPTSSFMVRADSFSIVNPESSKHKINSATMYSSWFGSWTTLVTATAHGLILGDYVSITDIPEIVGQHQVTAIVSTTSFSIARYSYPGYTISASSSVSRVTAPFVVTNGNVYIRSAVIANASITDAQIANVTADKITTGTLTATIGVSTGKIYGGVNPNYSFGSSFFGTGFYLGNDGGVYKLRVGSYDKNLTWDGTDLTVRGIIYASGGLIGGVAIDTVGLRAGQSAWNTGSGFYLGADGRFSLGTANSKYLTWDGSLLKFSGSLEAANGTFSGALSAATGTFSGSLTAGVVDLNAVIGQSFTYATAGTWTVVTMPYAGTVRVKLVGGGGGGGGGQGNTDARTDTSGLSGAYGNQYSVEIPNVPQGYVVKVIIGTGGAGGYAGATGSAGNPTFIRIEDPYGTLYALYSASGGAGGGHYRYNDNGDSGISGNLVARANGHSFRFPDAGDGAGWGSGQTGLPAPDIPGSAGGLGGFYDKEFAVYWGSLTEARRGDLNGGNGVRGGGGGGGMATRGRGFSEGDLIGYRSAVYDSVNGGAESNGGNGGDGYAFVEIFNPNGVVLASEFQTLKTGLQADFSVGVYNWSAVYTNNNPGVTSETIDILTSYGHGSYWLGYSSTPTGAITLSAYQGAGWTKPSGNTAVPKYTITYDDYGTYTSYLRVIYKANFKVIGAI